MLEGLTAGGGEGAGAFTALVVQRGDGGFSRTRTSLTRADLAPAELIVQVRYAGLNYKDALAASPGGKVAKLDRLVPGIDLVGTVVESADPSFPPGTEVIGGGPGLGVSHHGGFAELASLPSQWAVPLPSGLSAFEAMALGTAGLTVAMCIAAIERGGVEPASGPLVVSGASGGVGALAVAMAAGRGYEVVALTGKAKASSWLESLGASSVLARDSFSAGPSRPLERERFAAGIDTVGGGVLASMLAAAKRRAVVTACGMAAGTELSTTVFPFILRGVSLVGIDSAGLSRSEREGLWARLGGELRPPSLAEMATTIGWGELEASLDAMLAGGSKGRTVLDLGR